MMYENLRDFSFDMGLAQVIDNSLQALWSGSSGDRRLISVDVLEDRISVFDSGPGMDRDTILKWEKNEVSVHKSQNAQAFGGKPPYLVPFFGTFGYGGAHVCMSLGRRTLLSTKTKESDKVFTLQLDQEASNDPTVSEKNWKATRGMRNPSDEEMKLSPHGSFTKIEIFDWKCQIPDLKPFQCRLHDMYLPYIQCDGISETGSTESPVEFQVGGENLADISSGGVVATTNLNSMGPGFWFQIRFIFQSDKTKWTTIQEANARLRFAYFPVLQGKESIDIILETLEKNELKLDESFQTFRRVFVRRLGRLLPEVPWASIPFMEKGARATTLQKCCRRVICFVDLDAGFDPTPSKTDLASHNPFTLALKDFGGKLKENDNDVDIRIHKEGESLEYKKVEQEYKDWVLKMHNTYDVEEALGEDEETIVFDSLDHKSLRISRNCQAVRVHKVINRKGTSWERGQNIRILKGACVGAHKNNVYATIEYFLIEGYSGEAGGDARMICRELKYSEDEGCKLSIIDEIPRLEMRNSSSFPVSIIDSGMCLLLDEIAWYKQIQKQLKKDLKEGNSVTCKTKMVARPSSKVGSWKRADDLMFINVRVGISLPPFSIACYDEFDNRIPFSSVPSLSVTLGASSGLELVVEKFEASLTDDGVLKLKNMLVETGELDQIIPYYLAKLKICSKDELFSVSYNCTVCPGALMRVVESNPQAFENLLPGSTVENYVLEMFDRYDNHAALGTNVLISIHGFSVQDSMGLYRKVDNNGCIDLSGILKVTADYGEYNYVSLSVRSENGEIFKKESLIEERGLRLSTEIPLTHDPALERDEIGCSTPQSNLASTSNPGVVSPTQQTPGSQSRFLDDWESPSVLGSQTGPTGISKYAERLQEKLGIYTEHTLAVDEYLKSLEAEKEEVAEELSTLHAYFEPFGTGFLECLSTKESLMRKIKEKHQDTAAAVLNRTAPPSQLQSLSNNGVFGIAGLLGAVSSSALSRVLSDYLGEEIMLGLVCRSSRSEPRNTEYLKNRSKEGRVGSSITKGIRVLYLDSVRCWDGVVNNDPQKTLALETPKLPDGDHIRGFKGYAVNMIDLAPEGLHIQTAGGQGLRETLFYGLFGSLQVYVSQKHVRAALPYINGGNAVSLDGFIVKGNAVIYCRSSKPEIHFPITVKEGDQEKMRELEAAKDEMTMLTKKIAREKRILRKLHKKLEKTNERYYEARQVPEP